VPSINRPQGDLASSIGKVDFQGLDGMDVYVHGICRILDTRDDWELQSSVGGRVDEVDRREALFLHTRLMQGDRDA